MKNLLLFRLICELFAGLTGQIPGVSEANQVIQGSRQYGGDTYITVIIVVGFMVSLVLYVVYVAIPGAKAARENSQKLTEAIYGMSQVTVEMRADIAALKTQTNTLSGDMGSLTNCAAAAIEAIEKLSEKYEVNISGQLGVMKGALMNRRV